MPGSRIRIVWFNLRRVAMIAGVGAALALVPGNAAAQHTTQPFSGVKVNGGTATHSMAGGKHVLTLSDDFRVPDAPAPHWQLVDSRGNTYLLQRLVVKGDLFHGSIEIPSYVADVSKVQIWCAWAESLLGEARFATPIPTPGGR